MTLGSESKLHKMHHLRKMAKYKYKEKICCKQCGNYPNYFVESDETTFNNLEDHQHSSQNKILEKSGKNLKNSS